MGRTSVFDFLITTNKVFTRTLLLALSFPTSHLRYLHRYPSSAPQTMLSPAITINKTVNKWKSSTNDERSLQRRRSWGDLRFPALNATLLR